MAYKDYYEILGVGKEANDDEIRRAYRKLAQKYHPDRAKGDSKAEEKFKQINEAYQVLSDKQKRTAYDQFGTADAGGGGYPGGFGGFQGSGGFQGDFGNMGGGFADIFETFFGGGMGSQQRRAQQKTSGQDIEISLDLTFEQAIFGISKDLQIPRSVACQTCHGSGASAGSKVSSCKTCHGSGSIRTTQRTVLGALSTTRICSECNGEGQIPEKPCGSCKGSGIMHEVSKISIKIPGGVASGSVVRVSGKGSVATRGGKEGDLYVHINVLASPHFERHENEIMSNQEIHLLQAIFGDDVDIRTVHGIVKLKVPAGTQSGRVFKLKSYGVPKLRAEGRGDHLVRLEVKIPEKLTKKEKDLYAALVKEAGITITPSDKSFLGKLFG